jgi:formamidopyrimidine-DNA glycosylase
MPELPEVETVRRTLLPYVQGQRITGVVLHKPEQVRYPDYKVFALEVVGAHMEGVDRRGKYLIFRLSGDRQLICHLRMSGRLIAVAPAEPLAKHTHVVFTLGSGKELRYQDQRTFGGFHLVGPDRAGLPAGLRDLGPEPFDPAFTPAYLAERLAGRRTTIKAMLLDQTVVAGLGNIYADEALHASGLHPARPAGSLRPDEVERLHGRILAILQDAIARRGTTFSLYFDGENRQGDYYSELQVFDRAGEPCPTCGTEIQKTRVAGRGTHFCPRCQPKQEA